jgi:hypothetical protein
MRWSSQPCVLFLPLIPVDVLTARVPDGGPEARADGVGDRNHGHLHDLLVWDSEHVTGLLLVSQVQACPGGAEAA